MVSNGSNKKTGEQISRTLTELNPHFYRNIPILNATIEISKIRVQTIHISKGDEADNVAIVVEKFGDVMTLTSDPRLAYVALSRSSKRCFPRVFSNNLISNMKTSKYPHFAIAAEIYNKLFHYGND